MDDVRRVVPDWTSLPPDATEASLWDSLHDAVLINVSSDRLERTVRLEFDIWHLRTFYKLPDELTFVLILRGVQSARVSQSVQWPGEFNVPPGISREEEGRLIADYQAKWREESFSWAEFESKLSVGQGKANVLDAAYATGADGPFTIKLVLNLDDDSYAELFLRADCLEIRNSDDEPLGLMQFMRLGADYWEAFAANGRARRGAEACLPKE